MNNSSIREAEMDEKFLEAMRRINTVAAITDTGERFYAEATFYAIWQAANCAVMQENERLREALEFIMSGLEKFKSVDRDNMEFEGRITCYTLERGRQALALPTPPSETDNEER